MLMSMTFEEILTSKGLSDEDVQAVIGEMKTNKIYTSAEENIDIRYKKLKGDYDTLKNADKSGELATANNTITQLQQKIKELTAEGQLRELLSKENPLDVDYLMYKAKMSEKYSVGDDGKLANAAELVTALKAENPNQFSKGRIIKEQMLPEGQPSGSLTQADFKKMSYKDKAELYQSDPETYKTLSSGGNNNNG